MCPSFSTSIRYVLYETLLLLVQDLVGFYKHTDRFLDWILHGNLSKSTGSLYQGQSRATS